MSENQNNDLELLADRYQLERLIARGGMAEVYLATDIMLNREVAAKILFPEYAREESFVERFRREAQAAAKLNHPNIVAIYDWGKSKDSYFIGMEYVKGQSLREKLKAEGTIDSDILAEICADTASALAYAHENGIVHRDIKPGNILIKKNGKVKVTDFGIARAGTSEALTQTGSVMGTATYFSPEQAQGYNVDGRSDIYSLGVVMYELATGVPPFVADTPIAVAFKHVSEKVVPPTSRNPDISPEFEKIILKCLQKNADDRYNDANELYEDCTRYLRRRPVLADVASNENSATMLNPALIMEEPTMANAAAVVETRPTQAVGTLPPNAGGAGNNNGYEFSERSRKGPMVVVSIMAALLVLAVIGILFAVANQDKSDNGPKTLPSVIGLDRGEARKKLTQMGFEVKVVNTINEDVEEGKVFSQDPEVGTKLRKGNTVTIEISSGVGEEKVPDVADKTLTDASLVLEEVGFTLKATDEFSDSVETGKAIRSAPKAGTKQKRGSTIEVFFSKGSATVVMPNVLNLDSTTAAAQLGKAGFDVITVNETSDTVAAGKVIRTDPVANAEVAANASVTIYVSSGKEQVAVPDVIGKTQAEAVSMLGNAGFYTKVSGSSSTTAKVVSQNPSGGTLVDKSTQSQPGKEVTINMSDVAP